MINDYNKQKINDLLSAGLKINKKQDEENTATPIISNSIIGENINYTINNNHHTLWIILIVSVLGFASLFF